MSPLAVNVLHICASNDLKNKALREIRTRMEHSNLIELCDLLFIAALETLLLVVEN